jgi:hypothetical protein
LHNEADEQKIEGWWGSGEESRSLANVMSPSLDAKALDIGLLGGRVDGNSQERSYDVYIDKMSLFMISYLNMKHVYNAWKV